jgi:adenosylhomocysteine nucleosidase
MKRILICAAIPRELKYVERIFSSVKGERRTGGRFFSVREKSIEVILSETGIGIQRAESSIKTLLNDLHPDVILSLGFGGALYEGLAAGDIVWASRVLFLRGRPSGGQRAEIPDISLPGSKRVTDGLVRSPSFREGCIVTLEHLMTKPEIRESMPDGLSFPVCDMETFVLAKNAVQRQIPFFAARSISDTADQEISREILGLTEESGQIAYGRLGRSVFQKPGLIKELIRLGRNSEKAAKRLGSLVRTFLDTAA